MDERLLIDYLAQRINAAMLGHAPPPSRQSAAGEFELFPRHLLQLCDAALSGDIEPEQLPRIGRCLYHSSTFRWPQTHPDGRVVEEVLVCWLAYDDDHVPTRREIMYCREWLLYGHPAGSGGPE